MAERITETEVKQVIDTTLTDEEISPFIAAAVALVDDALLSENYGGALLKEITRYLAAHFVAIRDPRVTQEKLGDAQAKYEGTTGMGLNHTAYGQQAMILDTHGVLAAISSSKRPAEVKAL